MDYHHRLLLFFALFVAAFVLCDAQHEDIPYQNVPKICETCLCLSAQDADKRFHHTLSCAMKNFQHILPRWPTEFGSNHNGVDIVATFSGNSIEILQQLPATNASLTFTCRHCGIKDLQAPTFMDVPNIRRLDLSWNAITSDELTPDVFRGPYRVTHYEPIALWQLDLSHNQLRSLDRKLFEHMPQLRELNLSHNNFSVLDSSATAALASATSLKSLDLSFTKIKDIPAEIFRGLSGLQKLNLAGNKFNVVPAHLELIGRTLEFLNLAGNELVSLKEQNFLGFKVLKRLNISDMPSFRVIGQDTFIRLEALEYLYCSHNPRLETFDLDSLLHSPNLTHVDISNCNLISVTLNLNLELDPEPGSDVTPTQRDAPRPWTKLHVFETSGNPWLCDCDLLHTLEFIGSHHRRQEAETRCDTPYILAGARLSNLTAEQICSKPLPKKYRVIDDDPPRFLRKRYIILTLITAAGVIGVGVLIGFVVSCIRRRLKNDFGVEPIRYTSVRSSNLSAFAHVNTSNNITGHA